MNKARTFAVLFAAVLSLVARGADKDRWYVLEMFGGKAGWVRGTEVEKDGLITTRSEMSLSLGRAEGAVTMTMTGEFVETPEGKPVSMKRVQKFGAGEVVHEYTFRPEHIEVKTTQEGRTTSTTAPLPEGVWLPPAAAERYSLQRFKSGAKEIVVRTLSPESGPTIITITRTGFEPETIEVNGRKVEAIKCVTETSAIPMPGTEWIDAEGELIRTVTKLGEISLVMTAATRDEAMAEGIAPAPDAMAGTLVKPDKPIMNPRRVRKGVYLLSVDEGELPDLPETGTQRVERLSPREARVTVTAAEFAPAPEGDAANAALTASTTMCDTTDEKVIALAAKAGGEGAINKAGAEALRRLVHKHITNKNMNVGYATASEVVRNQAGDCSEHGVLLTALLRARGVPARAAAGLLYVEEFAGEKDVFGYHMWTQALLEIDGVKRWVDLDAVLPVGTPYDATHITIDTSELDDSDPSGGLLGVASVMGRLKIKVESLD